MRFALLLVPIFALSTAALAQAPAPLPPGVDFNARALADRLMTELNTSLQWQTRALTAEDQVKQLQAQIDALKKAAPAADPPK
jgi:hypothetical protein